MRARWYRQIACSLCMVLGLTLAQPSVTRAEAGWTRECPLGPPVVIDAGHGGVDGGAKVGAVLEKDITLQMAQRLAAALQVRQIPVALTRDADIDMGGVLGTKGRHKRDLGARIERVKQCGALLLVSVHVNSGRNPEKRGYVLFHQQSQVLSRDLAGLIDLQFKAGGLKRAEVILSRDFFVLRRSPVPAVLVELGFLTNPDDRSMLQQPAYQQQLADLLANACALAYRSWLPDVAAGAQYSSRRQPIY